MTYPSTQLFIDGQWQDAADGRYLAATAHGRLVTLPRVTHMVSVVRPEEFTRILLEGYAEASAA